MAKSNVAASKPSRNMKKVEGGSIAGFVNPSQLNVGDELSGIYRGNFVAGKYKSTTHKIEVEAPTAAVDADGKEVTVQAGELAGISGGGMLNKRLAGISEGTFVTITYTGKQKITTKGHPFEGSESNSFDVAYDAGAVEETL